MAPTTKPTIKNRLELLQIKDSSAKKFKTDLARFVIEKCGSTTEFVRLQQHNLQDLAATFIKDPKYGEWWRTALDKWPHKFSEDKARDYLVDIMLIKQNNKMKFRASEDTEISEVPLDYEYHALPSSSRPHASLGSASSTSKTKDVAYSRQEKGDGTIEAIRVPDRDRNSRRVMTDIENTDSQVSDIPYRGNEDDALPDVSLILQKSPPLRSQLSNQRNNPPVQPPDPSFASVAHASPTNDPSHRPAVPSWSAVYSSKPSKTVEKRRHAQFVDNFGTSEPSSNQGAVAKRRRVSATPPPASPHSVDSDEEFACFGAVQPEIQVPSLRSSPSPPTTAAAAAAAAIAIENDTVASTNAAPRFVQQAAHSFLPSPVSAGLAAATSGNKTSLVSGTPDVQISSRATSATAPATDLPSSLHTNVRSQQDHVKPTQRKIVLNEDNDMAVSRMPQKFLAYIRDVEVDSIMKMDDVDNSQERRKHCRYRAELLRDLHADLSLLMQSTLDPSPSGQRKPMTPRYSFRY